MLVRTGEAEIGRVPKISCINFSQIC